MQYRALRPLGAFAETGTHVRSPGAVALWLSNSHVRHGIHQKFGWFCCLRSKQTSYPRRNGCGHPGHRYTCNLDPGCTQNWVRHFEGAVRRNGYGRCPEHKQSLGIRIDVYVNVSQKLVRFRQTHLGRYTSRAGTNFPLTPNNPGIVPGPLVSDRGFARRIGYGCRISRPPAVRRNGYALVCSRNCAHARRNRYAAEMGTPCRV